MRRGGGGDRVRSLAASVAVHALVIAALARMVLGPTGWSALLDWGDESAPAERVQFLAVTPRGDAGATTQPGRAGGDGRPLRPDAEPPPPLTAPPEMPSALPPAPPSGEAPRETGGTGPLVGGGGPTAGLRPTFSDPRLWARGDEPVSPFVRLPELSESDRMDSVIVRAVERWKDSVLAANAGQAPRGWVFEKDGKKYGIEPGWIRLGKWSIPSAVLALLPLNVQGNPTTGERAARLASMRYEIDWQAARAGREDEFRSAVKAVRERKDRERRARLAAQNGEVPPDPLAPIVPAGTPPAPRSAPAGTTP